MKFVNLRSTGYVLLWLLTLLLPFERDRPLLTLGPLAITNLELLLGAILLVTAVVWWRERPFPLLPHRGVMLLLLAGGMFVVTALLAPEQAGNAFKASLRMLSGILLALTVPILVKTASQRVRLLLAIVGTGFLIALIGLAEVWLGREFGWLAPFRSGITVTGEFLRLTGPLDYANHAAMFIEVSVLLLVAAGSAWWRLWQKTAVLILVSSAMFLLVQASFQTLSRASFVTIGVVASIMVILVSQIKFSEIFRFRLGEIFKNKAVGPWLGLVGIVVLLFIFNTVASDVFRLRFASEGDNGWYEATWQVPPQLTLAANEVQQVPITVTNAGALTWSSNRTQPINLAGRWIEVERSMQLAEPRWSFAEPVVPGETVEMLISLRAPSIPGEYTLVWDVVHEQITWFGEKSGVFATSKVQVLPSNLAPFAESDLAAPAWRYSLPIPDRSTLWLLAGQLIAERPLLGIGLDNFRLIYGRLLDADSWNETIHTNNWYLEFLVGGGLLATLPFLGWLGWEGLRAWQVLRQPRIDPWLAGVLAALFAFLIHGLLDFFLLFNSTGLLFWLLVGLWWQFSQETT
ncbi:MAG: hypothetical protein DHS20C20_29800 [Ardenticatenaceae bacterium]|nr:MAG: hypothetical protein DHS20C20_29800 [Ardenticatenaceae bacterium]